LTVTAKLQKMEISMRAKMLATIPVVAAFLTAAMASPSDASFRRLRFNYEPGEVVVAHSHYGNGSIKSVVRPGRWGWQVRLPGGAWTDCRRSCEETLRVQTVDIFGDGDSSLDSGGYGTLTRECGVLGCLHWEYSF
jgi:hypothetical protein